jgi:ATP-dependent helicase HrpB
VTAHGRALAALPLHPRLAHMLTVAGRQAAPLAALLSDRDPLRGQGSDLMLRLDALAGRRPVAGPQAAAFARLREEARRLARGLPAAPALSPGAMLSLAYPDRIGQRRPGAAARFLLSGGKGAVAAPGDPLGAAPFLVVAETDGDPREALIRLALPVTEADLRALHADRLTLEETCRWDAREGRVAARRQERLGALVLSDRPWPDVPAEAVARAMCDGVRALGLRLSPAAERFRTRVALLRGAGADLPDLSDAALLSRLEVWLLPWLDGIRTAADWARFDLLPALRAQLDPGQMRELDAGAPAELITPLGRAVPIDYAGGVPQVSVRLQEMFGLTRHPMVGTTPVRITLLSPAGRPVQVTTDLPGFWATSYADVRREMRGRYPRHPWPEDPRAAAPTLRARPRGT